MKEIFSKNTNSKIINLHKSFHRYSIFNQKFIVISEDGQYIIGISKKNCRRIIIEQLNDNFNCGKSVQFGEHKNYIYSLSYNENLDSLFVVEYQGFLTQYQVTLPGMIWKKRRNFGFLDIKTVNTTLFFKNLLFFGGNNIVQILDTHLGILLEGTIGSDYENIFSI